MQKVFLKARAGDRTAEQEMFEYLLARFTYLAQRRISAEEARDVAQDACVTVLEKYRTEAPQDRFLAWAYEVLRNKIGNYYQHQKVQKKVMADLPPDSPARLPDRAEADLETRLKLILCLKRLVKAYPRFARILNLIYQGYTTDEICQRLRLTANNLYVSLTRSRKILNNCLEKGNHR
jgi:RNA polymerase sigma factor (sigma-70 family)